MGSGLSWNTQIILRKPGPRNPGIPGTLPWDQPASLRPSRASSPALFHLHSQRHPRDWRWQKGARPFLPPTPPLESDCPQQPERDSSNTNLTPSLSSLNPWLEDKVKAPWRTLKGFHDLLTPPASPSHSILPGVPSDGTLFPASRPLHMLFPLPGTPYCPPLYQVTAWTSVPLGCLPCTLPRVCASPRP